MIQVYFFLMILMVFTGCSVPSLHSPSKKLEVPEHWQSALDSDYEGMFESLLITELFNDKQLISYLEEIEANNPDILVAKCKIDQAIAMRCIAGSLLSPEISMGSSYVSSNPGGGKLVSKASNNFVVPTLIRQQSFLAGFDALWEIDLFGKRQHELASANQNIYINSELYQAVLTSLKAEFARLYIEMIKLQSILKIQKKSVAILKKKDAIYRLRNLEGLDSLDSDLRNRMHLKQAEALLEETSAEVEAVMFNLSFILGRTPCVVNDGFNSNSCSLEHKPNISLGMPAEVLQRRPDIKAAEFAIYKASEDVQVSIADLYPRLNLLGSFGYQNLHIGSSKGEGNQWSYGGNVISPLFQGGKIRANISLQQSVLEEAVSKYHSIVLRAFKEAEESIVRYEKSLRKAKSIEDAYNESIHLLSKIKSRQDSGLSNSISALDGELKVLQDEIDRVNVLAENKILLIGLYKVLGGSWKR